MRVWLEHHKPRASSRRQLFLAATLWSVVGCVLFFFGCRWIFQGVGRISATALIFFALVLGLLKGLFILDGTARQVTARILERGEDRCLGGFLSWKSWLLIAIMSIAGRFLRGGILPTAAAGTLYAAIGTGLFFSSRIAWRRWSLPERP